MKYLMVVLFPFLVVAQFRPASEISVQTEVYKPDFKNTQFEYGTYEYDASWEGIPAASATLDLKPEGGNYRLVATAKSASGIDIFYKLRYRAEGLLDYSYSPIRTFITHKENSRERIIDMTFNKDGSVRSIRTTKGKGTEVEEFNPNNFMLDPFSSALLARSLSWDVGESKTFDTFNGKTRYLITLTCESEKTMKVNGEDRKVWIIVPQVKNLNNPEKDRKLRRAEIYVTADKYREVLQIKSSVFIGNVYVKLRSFKPDYVSGVQMARSNPKEWIF
jgi:hypothetical protein